MLSFECDYSEGAHEKILQRLLETNMEKLPGYGTDKYCESAKRKIREFCHCPKAEVFFLTGGTQTNEIIISAMLQSYEGVIAAKTGHINVHEAGAIEFTGHKVLEVEQNQGKIDAASLEKYLQVFHADVNNEHMVYPGMVYISHPTEYGTLYTKEELQKIADICKNYEIPLYMDGARLGYGLACENTDVKIEDIVECCDVFYIGGTKVGAFCGEAVVFTRQNVPKCFQSRMKQQGALMAKGRLLGIQFDTLFTDNLYLKLGKNAIETAELLKNAFREKGYEFYIETPTNQIFIILDNDKLQQIQEQVRFSFWESIDENHTVVRFATSWATTKEDVQELIKLL